MVDQSLFSTLKHVRISLFWLLALPSPNTRLYRTLKVGQGIKTHDMREFWKCECNLSTYADFISRLRKEAVAQLDVNYSIHFDPSQRTPSIDIALDDVECRYLLSSNADGSLHLFDTGNPICGDNGKLTFPKLARIDTIPDNLLTNVRRSAHSGLSPSNCVQWNPVDSGFFITTSLDKTLKIWDTNRLECVDLIETAEPMSWAALSTVAVEHNLIAVALTQSCDRQAILVDPIVGAPAISLRGGHTDSHLSQIIWSMRSSFVVITAGLNTVRLAGRTTIAGMPDQHVLVAMLEAGFGDNIRLPSAKPQRTFTVVASRIKTEAANKIVY
ncbi:DNA excision repair protein ERCC-8 [Sparganum proliferum]